jgi:hypothetical protein
MHSISYCGHCWLDLQATRRRRAPPLKVVAVTARGKRLLQPPALPSVTRQLFLFTDGAA